MDNMFKILFFTGNENKAQELQNKLGSNFCIYWKKIDIPESQGEYPDDYTNDTILKQSISVSIDKFNYIKNNLITVNVTNSNSYNFSLNNDSDDDNDVKSNTFDGILVEDTSLWLHELMAPGPFIKSWSHNDYDTIYRASVGCKDKTATAASIFIFAYLSKSLNEFTIHVIEGICEGSICSNEIGNGEFGFGWDKYFIPKNNNSEQKSFAQIEIEKKNKISHRGIALNNLVKILTSELEI